jgi:prevent-host-death family protein
MARQTSIKNAKDKLSVFVNMVAREHERVVLTSRGRPKTALIGLDDLAALEDLTVNPTRDDSALADADSLKVRILRRRHGLLVTDSAEDLAAIRDAGR